MKTSYFFRDAVAAEWEKEEETIAMYVFVVHRQINVY
jgi:hypothetical protein